MNNMKVLLCSVQVPFIRGGAESLFDNLYAEMQKRGYDVDYVKIPFKWYPPQDIINHALIWRLMDIRESNGNKIDCVIAHKFPSYLVNHPNKVIWLLHQHRTAYDLANSKYDDLSHYGIIGEVVRKKIHYMDSVAFKEAKKVFTISQNVSDRLLRFNNVIGEPLYHPPPFMGRYYSGEYSDYIFYPSRLDTLKRQALIIQSLKYIKSPLRLKIAGAGPCLQSLIKTAHQNKVEKKVDFLGYISDEELLDLYANAFCVTYVPVDEDLGYVTLEALLSKKPVITCTDSGGPLEFIEDSSNGCVVEPVPEEIAQRIDTLYEKSLAPSLGREGYKRIMNMNLSWNNVIARLMEPFK